MKNFIFVSLLSWRMLDLKSKMYLYVSIMLFFSTTILRVSTPVVFSYLVDITYQPVSYIVLICGGYALMFFILRFLEEFRLAFYVYFEQVLQKNLILTTLRKYFKMKFSSAKKNTSSEATIIIDRGLGGVRSALYNAIFTLLPLIFECVFILSIIWLKLGVILAMEILLILALFISFTYYFSSKTQLLQQKWFATASRSYKLMSEGIRAFEALRSFQSTAWMTERYEKATNKFIHEVKVSLRPGILLGITQGVLLFALFFVATYNVVQNAPSPSEMISLLVLVNGLLLQIALPLLQFSASYKFFIQGLSSARQLFDMMLYPSSSEKISHHLDTTVNGFEITGVAIDYSRANTINYNNFFIPEKVISVISGASGVGKSSFAKALAGISEYSGEIKTKFTPEDIFYLHQSVDVFDTSFTENIILGNEFIRQKFDKCIADAGFSPSEVISLSERSLGEMGSHVSGGQAQRIGLARMLYHDAKVMIFDEPTTGLDDETVVKVLHAIKNCSFERTTIIITHDARVKSIGQHFIALE